MLGEALAWLGSGAKTAVGYGRFERDAEGERRRKELIERERHAKSEAERLAREQAEFQASLANDSAALQQLKQLRRDQGWKLAASDHNMLSALEAFAQSHDDPPRDCLDWIRKLLESIPSYEGVWENPEATKGKAKKPKPKYSSRRIRGLVRLLNSDRGS